MREHKKGDIGGMNEDTYGGRVHEETHIEMHSFVFQGTESFLVRRKPPRTLAWGMRRTGVPPVFTIHICYQLDSSLHSLAFIHRPSFTFQAPRDGIPWYLHGVEG